MARRVLVTGGGGFIGSNLVRGLLAHGDEVRVLDNFATGSRTNLDGVADDVEVVEGELRSYERVHNAVRGVEVVFHLGALGSVPRSVQDPLTTSAVNVEGTLNVLLAARDEGIRRVVFASSSSVYGSAIELPAREDGPVDPISPYGVAKLAAERYCVSFSRVYDSFETVVLRYFNVFGPRQNPLSQYAAVVPLFLTAIARGEPVTIFGDGGQSRDFTYVDNVVDAKLRAADGRGRQRPHLQRRRRLARDRRHSSPRRSGAPREARREALRAAASRRHPRLVGGRSRPRARCSAGTRRSASRTASGARRTPSLAETDPRPPRDRPPQHGRAGAARRLPLRRARRSAATRRRSSRASSPAARSRWRSSPRGSASRSLAVSQLHREISPLRDPVAAFRLAG